MNEVKNSHWQLSLGLALILLSALFYAVHYVIFRDAHHILLYLVGDIAFIPLEVLFVTLILHRILSIREKAVMLNKLNMVIGAFFSEVGNPLLRIMAEADHDTDLIRRHLLAEGHWSDRKAIKQLKDYDYVVEISPQEMASLKEFLVGKRNFMLRLLENPNLLEHETFTELLWSVFHLVDEFSARNNVQDLHPTDCRHVTADIQRAYRLLTLEWLSYMQHLQKNYPYLFSFAMRMNPFDPGAAPEVRK